MNSPITALAWDIWQRGKRSAVLALGCMALCVLVNLVSAVWLPVSNLGRDYLSQLFAMMMVLSFFLLMGVFNYTEYNSTREWNGFPYRLFTMPVATWQLVTLPIVLCVVFAELFLFAWIKLVWTHETVPKAGWFAVVLGAYVVFYQTALWCLAGCRLMRIAALGLGGASCIAVATLPFLAASFQLSWVSERRLVALMVALATLAYGTALSAIGRQRRGGRRRRSWMMTLSSWRVDVLPQRTRDFTSRAAAQFWFEWRRVGWLLPHCILLVITLAFPISWFKRGDPAFVDYLLTWLLLTPLVLSAIVGKGFVKCEFWSADFGLPNFIAVRPLSAVEYVGAKLKVAAVSVTVAWLLLFGFLILWLSLWADATELRISLFLYRERHPHSWPAIGILCLVGLMILSWRLMVGGLWVGLRGHRTFYMAWSTLQILVPALGLLAAGIWSERIDGECQTNPVLMRSLALNGLGWCLSGLVIFKFWLAAFTWAGVDLNFARRYFMFWAGGLACLLALALLACPFYDVYRYKHLWLLTALLAFPLARCGLAPGSFAKNRHR